MNLGIPPLATFLSPLSEMKRRWSIFSAESPKWNIFYDYVCITLKEHLPQRWFENSPLPGKETVDSPTLCFWWKVFKIGDKKLAWLRRSKGNIQSNRIKKRFPSVVSKGPIVLRSKYEKTSRDYLRSGKSKFRKPKFIVLRGEWSNVSLPPVLLYSRTWSYRIIGYTE